MDLLTLIEAAPARPPRRTEAELRRAIQAHPTFLQLEGLDEAFVDCLRAHAPAWERRKADDARRAAEGEIMADLGVELIDIVCARVDATLQRRAAA